MNAAQAAIHKGLKALRGFSRVKNWLQSLFHKRIPSMLFELRESIAEAIDEAYKLMATEHYTDYILYIGRGNTIPGLKKQLGTDNKE